MMVDHCYSWLTDGQWLIMLNNAEWWWTMRSNGQQWLVMVCNDLCLFMRYLVYWCLTIYESTPTLSLCIQGKQMGTWPSSGRVKPDSLERLWHPCCTSPGSSDLTKPATTGSLQLERCSGSSLKEYDSLQKDEVFPRSGEHFMSVWFWRWHINEILFNPPKAEFFLGSPESRRNLHKVTPIHPGSIRSICFLNAKLLLL